LYVEIFKPTTLEKKAPERNVQAQIVVPGEIICEAAGFMRGHGTFVKGGNLVASVSGVVERVNKFVCVRPLKSRFTGDVGDVVVGRVTTIQGKRWKVDVQGRQDGVLLLSSIDLPGDERRRRTEQDQLQMRSLFLENDLISAEVQQYFPDHTMSLHTRHKYGKLAQGFLVSVSPTLIRRAKSHFVSLECGVDLIIGNNGNIWVSPTAKKRITGDSDNDNDEDDVVASKTTNEATTVHPEVRLNMARVRNSIISLSKMFMSVHPLTIQFVFMKSIELGFAPKDMLHPQVIAKVTEGANGVLVDA